MQTHMDVINEIMNDSTDFDVLDVQDRTGVTGYIDFIDLSEITAPVIFDERTDDNTIMNIRLPNYNIDENKNISVTNLYKRPMSVKLSLCTTTQQ